MKKYLFLLIYFSFFSAVAQQKLSKKGQNNFEKAQQYFQRSDYNEALNALKEVVRTDPDYQLAYIQIGDLYRKNRIFKDAIPYYTKSIALSPPPPEGVFFALGECELNIGDYENAKQHLSFFLSMVSTKPEAINKAKKYLLDCNFAIENIKNPVLYEPINIGPAINSVNREYFPTVTADGEIIIFTRQIDGKEDFYISHLKNNVWQTAVPLSKNINTPQFNEGAQTITPDGLYLFFTGCNRPGGYGRCDIYVSHKEGNDWGKPINLGEPLNSPYWESQPAITPDGNTLYFVSNRPGGYGGYDIYKSTVNENGEWSQPENLGPDINSPFDENTPFIHPDGKTMYFSSDGWPGFGNKDIFFSRMDENGKWGKPQNIGYPINSFNEETGLTVTADGLSALFSTEMKSGYGSQDIYSFKMPEHARPQPITYVKGVVKDRETKKFLEANVVVKDLKNDKTVFNDYTSAETGNFLTVMPIGSNYAFNVKADGYIFYSGNYELNKISGKKPFEIEILLDKIKVGTDVTLRNIFFENNKYELLSSSIVELATLVDFLNDNSTVGIEIQGHTDNKGDDKLNEKLSLNRAMAVYNYLIEKKIDASRLSFKGYGKSKPIADNATEEGQQLNRRTSFIVTKI